MTETTLFPAKIPSRPIIKRDLHTYTADPLKSLIAAYMCRAVADYLYPRSSLLDEERASAAELLHSDDGLAMLNALGIPRSKLKIFQEQAAEVCETSAGSRN